MNDDTSNRRIVAIKGAGEMASGIAWRLYQSGFREIFMMETHSPLAVRRTVSFCEAIHEGCVTVEGVSALRVGDKESVLRAWQDQCIAVAPDPGWNLIGEIRPRVVIDAIMAKKNLGTTMAEAPLVIGCGPGFTAGRDVHCVIETHRGHCLGRVIEEGMAIPNTGIPGDIGGYTVERVLRAPRAGVFEARMNISDRVEKGQVIGRVRGEAVTSSISGILRGVVRSGLKVARGLKIGDVDPRAREDHCYTVSDKARAIGGGVLEAILRGRPVHSAGAFPIP